MKFTRSCWLLCLVTLQAASLTGCKSDAEKAAELSRQQQVQLDARIAVEEAARKQEVARTKAAIELALHDDLLTGKDPTTGHVSAMRSIDLSQCPPDFRVAYMKHIHAWDEAVAVARAKVELDSENDEAEAAGIIAAVFGSSATPYGDHVAAEKQMEGYARLAVADISSTFHEVEDIAALYGAQVPH